MRIDLRLVRLPSTVEFTHPQDLEIISDGKVFHASDRFAERSPSPNVSVCIRFFSVIEGK
ncbi:DUF3122 domain-containing protein [Pleurocapsales cyanobacterium LEGE 06147]|nr:DUF3122 domain-containing protein [Pleurocapsales cyanobacterium LEGE 06147]